MDRNRLSPAVMLWSGGKDSGMALERVLHSGAHEVVALITTVNQHFRRVSMHGVREELIEQQAQAIGIPLHKMYVGGQGGNDDYIAALRGALETFKTQGVRHVIFGDIFLEDLRRWRELLLSGIGLSGVFPLWLADTRQLAREFVERRFKAVVCCVDDARLTQHDVGRTLDAEFFAGLPEGVDPCGENGEYHSFLYDGPIFAHPVAFELGQTVYRPLAPPASDESAASKPAADEEPAIAVPAAPGPTATRGFWFVDLLPAAAAPAQAAAQNQRTKTCSACGAEFYCRPAGGCWCTSVRVPREALRGLEGRYQDCLCPACLGSLAQP